MIRFVLRFVGLLLLALAFIFVIYDGTKSIAGRGIFLTKAGQFWFEIHTASQQTARELVERQSAGLWDLAVQPVLDQPAAAVFGVLSVILILLGRRKRPLIGYARD